MITAPDEDSPRRIASRREVRSALARYGSVSNYKYACLVASRSSIPFIRADAALRVATIAQAIGINIGVPEFVQTVLAAVGNLLSLESAPVEQNAPVLRSRDRCDDAWAFHGVRRAP